MFIDPLHTEIRVGTKSVIYFKEIIIILESNSFQKKDEYCLLIHLKLLMRFSCSLGFVEELSCFSTMHHWSTFPSLKKRKMLSWNTDACTLNLKHPLT